MFKIDSIVINWLEENKELVLKNISDTILVWLNENKDDIYNIIKENSKQ